MIEFLLIPYRITIAHHGPDMHTIRGTNRTNRPQSRRHRLHKLNAIMIKRKTNKTSSHHRYCDMLL